MQEISSNRNRKEQTSSDVSIAYRGVMYPGMYKSANKKAPTVKAKLNPKEYCWQIEPKGSYVLMPERTTSKTTPKGRGNSKARTKKMGIKAASTGKMSIARKVTKEKNRRKKTTGRKVSQRWKSTKRRGRTTAKKKSRVPARRTFSKQLTTRKKQLRRSSTTQKSGHRSKKQTSRTTKSRKQKKVSGKKKHSATARRQTKKSARTTKRFRKSNRTIAKSRGRSTKTTKKLSRAKTKKGSTRRPLSRKTLAEKSTTKARNKTTTVKSRRTSRRSKEAHCTSRRNKWTTRKPKQRTTRKGARKSKCKANGTADVELSCSRCRGRDEKTLMPSLAHARKLVCTKFYIICNCPGGQCPHETNRLIPLCDLSHLGQQIIDQLKSGCVASGCEYFNVRSNSPMEHFLAYYNGYVREGWSPVEQKWNSEQKRLNDYCGNRSEGFERAFKPPVCTEQGYETFNGCKVPDQHIMANASCTGCRTNEIFVSLSDRFECTLKQDACKCQSDSCRGAEWKEYIYVAYCIVPQGQIGGYLDKCHRASCTGGIQARTDNRDYYLVYDGRKLLKGVMRYRGQSTKTLSKRYTIAEYCSIQLNGYALVEHPVSCKAQPAVYDHTSRTVYCEYCDGDASKVIEAGTPMVQCKLTEYLCIRPGLPNITMRYCEMNEPNSLRDVSISQHTESCTYKGCLYAFVYVDQNNKDRVPLGKEGLLYTSLLRIDKNLSIPIARAISRLDECRRWRDPIGVNMTVLVRPFCTNCHGIVEAWQWTRDFNATPNCVPTNHVCATVINVRESPQPSVVASPNLMSYCAGCRGVGVSGFPLEGTYRLILDGVNILPGVSIPNLADKKSIKVVNETIGVNRFCGQNYKKSQVYCESCNDNTSARIPSNGPPILCIFTNYTCDSFYGKFIIHYCDMIPENNTQAWRIDKYYENCRSKNCLYVSVYSDSDQYEREIIAYQGVFCPGLLKVTRDVSVPVRESDRRVKNMCQHVGGENKISIFTRPFCTLCDGSWSISRPAPNKADGRLADQIECRMRQVRCACRGEWYCDGDSVTHRVCITGTWTNTSSPCCPVEVDKPIETQYPGLVKMCQSVKCAAVQVAGAWPMDESWRLLTDRFQIFPGVWRPVGRTYSDDKAPAQLIKSPVRFGDRFCEKICTGTNRSQSRVAGPTIQTKDVPIVCTYCNGSLSSMANTSFTTQCNMQRVDCLCDDSFVIDNRTYYEKAANICNIDAFSEEFAQHSLKKWRDYCHSVGCVFPQAYFNHKPYILYNNKIMYPGKVIEPRNQFPSLLGLKLPHNESYFLLPNEMSVAEYCNRLQQDKDMNAYAFDRYLNITPIVWQLRRVLICTSCPAPSRVRYPSIGLQWVDCSKQTTTCDCNIGSSNTEKKGICVESLPYCDWSKGTPRKVEDLKRLCPPECDQLAIADSETFVPLRVGNDLYQTEVKSPSGSFNMTLPYSTIRSNSYCAYQSEYGLLRIPDGEAVTAFLMCTFCDQENSWTSKRLMTPVTCTIETLVCPCVNCTCYDCKETNQPAVPHCLPICNIDPSLYPRWQQYCQENGCKWPQVIYNADWYLMAANRELYPGIYKFRLFASQRKIDAKMPKDEYCQRHKYYSPYELKLSGVPAMFQQQHLLRCSYDRDIIERPPWNKYARIRCSSPGTNNTKNLCKSDAKGSRHKRQVYIPAAFRALPKANPVIKNVDCGNTGPLTEGVQSNYVIVLGATGKRNGETVFQIFQTDYDRLLRMCAKYSYTIARAEADFGSFFSMTVVPFMIFGTGEIMH